MTTIAHWVAHQGLAARAFAALLMLALLSACSLFGPAKTSQQTPVADPDSVYIGYTLLYGFVATQKNSDKLLIIKRVSPEVKQMIEDIAKATGQMDEELKMFAKEDPAIELDRRVLPFIEARQRESASAERGKQFLEKSGKDFERLLLLTQSGVLTTERHLARVMRDSEQNPARRAFWERAVITFDDLYARLVRQLDEHAYYT